MKKGGKGIFFPQIDLKFTKLQKKMKIFCLRHAPPQNNKFHLGKKINQEGKINEFLI